jgi:hypothetical protein
MTAIADAIDDLRTCLPQAAVLVAQPDTGAVTRGGRPGSRPPWNQAPANAEWDTLGVIADVLAMFRLLVTGHPGERPPASATGPALAAIVRLSYAVPPDMVRAAARELARCAHVIRMLPAIDLEERWEKFRADAQGQRPRCPHCGQPDLRVAVRAGLVACVTIDCADYAGNRPVASMTLGAVSGTPMVVGSDGTVWQVAP